MHESHTDFSVNNGDLSRGASITKSKCCRPTLLAAKDPYSLLTV
jgi:hypothetical protein